MNIERRVPPVNEMEFLTLKELADEFYMDERKLIRILKRKGHILPDMKPSASMYYGGFMVFDSLDVNGRGEVRTVVTSKGYFFLKNLIGKNSIKNFKTNYYDRKGKKYRKCMEAIRTF